MLRRFLLPIALIASLTAFAQHDVPPTTQFTVSGAVKHELTVHTTDFAAYKQDALGDVVIKNHRGEVKSTIKNVKGILLKTILDSAHITVDKPKEYGEYVISLIASDGYRNMYSWNELFNTEIGNHVYVITEIEGKTAANVDGRILVFSMSDFNQGSRHLKGLSKIEIKKMQ